MTTAVCIRCGAIKFGAFNPCSACGFRPDLSNAYDFQTSLALTDHYYSEDELERMGHAIANGEQLILAESPIEDAVHKHNQAVELAFGGERDSALELVRKAHAIFLQHGSEHAEQSANLIAKLESGEPIEAQVPPEVERAFGEYFEAMLLGISGKRDEGLEAARRAGGAFARYLPDQLANVDELIRKLEAGEPLVDEIPPELGAAIQHYSEAVEFSRRGCHDEALASAREAHRVFVDQAPPFAGRSAELIDSLESRRPAQ